MITNSDRSALANGFTVPAGQVWEFDPNQSVTIEVSQNVRVEGVLRMRPASPAVQHHIQFTNVDEGAFVGGGMQVLDSDVGLWVMGAGQLDLQGAKKLGWARAAGGVGKNADRLTLDMVPEGWAVGDKIVISPTEAPGVNGHYTHFEERTITAISGREIVFDRPLSHDHPQVNGAWNPEVMNLTRNVRIEGEGNNSYQIGANGRSHILIHSSSPQLIKYIQLRHMGPRTGTSGATEGVTGRYPLHFHHSGDGSRGSIVEGVVVRQSGNRAYVPHASNGITIRDSIAYDGSEDPFWWDPPGPPNTAAMRRDFSNDSSDILLDRNIAAWVHSESWARGRGGYRLSGFHLSTGKNLVLRDSVAVGVEGNVQSSGFQWPGHSNVNSSWIFDGNIAHNNKLEGIFIWQNNSGEDPIVNYVGYHNGSSGIEQGAYLNSFEFKNITLFSNGTDAMVQHNGASMNASRQRSDGYSFRVEGLVSNGSLIIEKQALDSTLPDLFKDCEFTDVVVRNAQGVPGLYDFVDCGLQSNDFKLERVKAGTVIRVQNGARAFQIDSSGNVSSIAPFYPR